MEPSFWHQKWQANQLGFHQEKVNSRLMQHWDKLGLASGSDVFVPLCGKSRDMKWLADQSHPVIGNELSEEACRQFFTEHNLDAAETRQRDFLVFESEHIRLLAGDFFSLDSNWLTEVSGVFDRAALIALPPDMRRIYADKMAGLLSRGARMLLITAIYDESKMSGPPFSVEESEVRNLFRDHFEIEVIAESSGPEFLGSLKDRGLDDISEQVFLMERR